MTARENPVQQQLGIRSLVCWRSCEKSLVGKGPETLRSQQREVESLGSRWGLVRRWCSVLFPLSRSASRALRALGGEWLQGLGRCGHRSGEPGLVLGRYLRKAERRSVGATEKAV